MNNSSNSSSSRRRMGGSWDDRGSRLQQQQQLSRKDEDLALFQDMRIRGEHSSNILLDPTLDHLHGTSSSKFRGGIVPAAARRGGSNDLLTSEMDKNDYDWLLTPPGTPLFPSLDRDFLVATSNSAQQQQQQRDSSRWPSKLSRPSIDQVQLGVSSSSSGSSAGSASRLHSASSITSRGNPSPRRQSAPSSIGSNYNYNNAAAPKQQNQQQQPQPQPQRGIPGNGNAAPRSLTPTRRPSSAPSPSTVIAPRRPSTPTRSSTTTATSFTRPSTPTRTSPAAPSASRSSTPTRRSSLTPASASAAAPLSNGRTSRGTSPIRRPPSQAAAAPHEHRSASNSRAATTNSRSSAESVTAAAAVAALPSSHLTRSYNHLERDMSSFTRRSVTSANDALPKSDPTSRKTVAKSCTGSSRETSFFGTSISKKSIDTAIRHMDIRRSSPSAFRAPPPAATTTYPKSSRSSQFQQQQEHPQQQQQQQPDRSISAALGLFEQQQGQDHDDSSFLLEFTSLTSSTEATFLDDADYLKDP